MKKLGMIVTAAAALALASPASAGPYGGHWVAAGTGEEAIGEVAGTAVVGSGATAFGCLSRFSAVRRRSVLEPIMRIRRNAGGCRTRTTGRGKFAKDIEAHKQENIKW
jgi:hypothetical protein